MHAGKSRRLAEQAAEARGRRGSRVVGTKRACAALVARSQGGFHHHPRERTLGRSFGVLLFLVTRCGSLYPPELALFSAPPPSRL
mmetsp:Transcript_17758/g.35039  ORF Transcript_17758/g.35039 Transcript_17758/m.35039 type:complete len:85 (+) Transcript_17758:1726-1980(+)